MCSNEPAAETRRDCPISAARQGRDPRYLQVSTTGRAVIIRVGTAILVALGLAGLLGGCSSGSSSEIKVGGAWPSQPVKCSAYEHGSAEYQACGSG